METFLRIMKYFIISTVIFFISLLTIIYAYGRLSGLTASPIDKYKLRKRAEEYFSEKYTINKRDINIVKNNFSIGCHEISGIKGCDNELIITYNDRECKIIYNEKLDIFGDDCEYKIIKNELNNYVSLLFSDADEIDIYDLENDLYWEKESYKYNGNLEEYFKILPKRAEIKYNNVTKHNHYATASITYYASDPLEALNKKNKIPYESIMQLKKLYINIKIKIEKAIIFKEGDTKVGKMLEEVYYSYSPEEIDTW